MKIDQVADNYVFLNHLGEKNNFLENVKFLQKYYLNFNKMRNFLKFILFFIISLSKKNRFVILNPNLTFAI